MRNAGPLIASGRDADIFECGPGLVLRRSRHGRSMADEARTMEYLLQHSYPVPSVYELSEDGTELVMERIEGVTMVQAVARAPWTVRRSGRVLADLHRALHEIPAPGFLPAAPAGQGDRLLHMDLHPLNVMMSRRGPKVIDWSNATIGDPALDVALAFLLMSAAEIPGGRIQRALLGQGRGLMVRSFICRFDDDSVRNVIGAAVDWKTRDPNMSDKENAAMRVVADQMRASGVADRAREEP
jgi:aminoglycoside phosphotransferase (APT) family kinase protein